MKLYLILKLNIINISYFFSSRKPNHDGMIIKVSTERITLSLYQCPICEKYFSSSLIRQNHERKVHTEPIINKNVFNDSETQKNNLVKTNKQKFLTYFNLVKRVTEMPLDRLGNRKHLQVALRLEGNILGNYNCHYCE